MVKVESTVNQMNITLGKTSATIPVVVEEEKPVEKQLIDYTKEELIAPVTDLQSKTPIANVA